MSRAALLAATCLSSLTVLASAPALGQQVNVNAGETVIVSGNVTLSTVNIGQSTGPGLFEIRDVGSLNSTSATLGVISAAEGNIAEVRGTWINSGNLDVGLNGRNNNLTIESGGDVTSSSMAIGRSSADNTGTVTGSGSTLTITNIIQVGDTGAANRLDILAGGDVFANHVVIGSNSNENNVLVDGTGSTLDASILEVGLYGSLNALTISNGGRAESDGASIGSFPGANQNRVEVSGEGSTWDNGVSTVFVGEGGNENVISILNGGDVTAGGLLIGFGMDAASNGVTVDGGGSTLSIANDLQVGVGGDTNGLIVSAGGTVTANASVLGVETTSQGNTALVTGENSSWTITEGLTVGGSGGENRVTVNNGGSVTAGSVSIGFNSADNSLTVDGASGDVASRIGTEQLVVGFGGGANTLTLSNGAEASSTFGGIGMLASANGNSVTVSGDAVWNIARSDALESGLLFVGREGSLNRLEVSEGGKVEAAGRLNIGGDLALSDYEEGTASNNRVVVAGSAVDGVETRLISRGITVGVQGSGNNVEVLTGGLLRTQGNALIGNSLTENNSVTVHGQGSRWLVSGDLGINEPRTPGPGFIDAPLTPDRANRLVIDDGGQVEVANDLVVLGDGVIDLGAGASLSTGTLALSDQSLLSVFVDDQRNSALGVAGLASLDGDLEVKLGTADLQDNRYTILTAGSIAGKFDAFELIPFDGIRAMSALQAALLYSSTEVTIFFGSDIGGGEALSRNQTNVSSAIDDYFNAGGVLPESFVPLFGLTGGALASTLDQLSGEVGATGGAQSAMRVNTLLLGQMTDAGLAAAGPAIVPTADAPAPSPAGWSAWGSVMASTSELPGDDNPGSHDTQSDVAGIATGWDMDIAPGSRLGFAIGAGTTNWDIDDGLGKGESTYLALGAYGAQRFGDSYLSLAGSYAWHAMSTERRVSLSGSQTLEADFNASSLSGRLEFGHRFAAADSFGLTPYGALQGQTVYMPDYDEEASGDDSFALAYDSGTATALRGELGARFNAELSTSARLFGRLAWAHDWTSDPEIDASFQSLPGAAFTVSGAEAPDNIALASLGLEASLSDRASISGGIEGELGEDYSSLAGTIALRVSW